YLIGGNLRLWQKRFWEHTIRDEADFACHFDYLHFNPVKHGYVGQISDWQNRRKPVFGFRLSGGKGVLQRSQLVPDPQGQGGVWRVFILPENANAV
uniref:transposase n=1 Tax=Neisseria meningitidis TaxID=487 RepID=UPI003703D2F1